MPVDPESRKLPNYEWRDSGFDTAYRPPDDAWMLNRAFGATYAETTESRGLYFSLIGGSLIGGATFSAGAGGSAG
jgi:hypothetical protein